jgi:hypothetical protein
VSFSQSLSPHAHQDPSKPREPHRRRTQTTPGELAAKAVAEASQTPPSDSDEPPPF